MSSLIDIYNGVLKYNGKNIIIVIDDNLKEWFAGGHISDILGYKHRTDAVRKKVKDKNKTTYGKIKQYSRYEYYIQDNMVFIDEAGLYQLAWKSKSKIAQNFQDWVTNEVIPALRKEGRYIIEEKYLEEIMENNKLLEEREKRILILENNQAKPKYPEGGYVYAIQPPNQKPGDNLTKIGYTESLNGRLKTHNISHPDNMLLVHKVKVDDPITVEHCVKTYLSGFIYRNKKEFYKVNPDVLIYVMDECAKTVNNLAECAKNGDCIDLEKMKNMFASNKMKRALKSGADEHIYGIFSVTKEQEERDKEIDEREEAKRQKLEKAQDGKKKNKSTIMEGGFIDSNSLDNLYSRCKMDYIDLMKSYST